MCEVIAGEPIQKHLRAGRWEYPRGSRAFPDRRARSSLRVLISRQAGLMGAEGRTERALWLHHWPSCGGRMRPAWAVLSELSLTKQQTIEPVR